VGIKKPQKIAAFLLLRQGSNLNFTDPESVVLPITPRSSLGAQRYIKSLKSKKEILIVAGCWVLDAGCLLLVACCLLNKFM
jgi:hypothetical protein